MIKSNLDQLLANRQGHEALCGLAGNTKLSGNLILCIARDVIEPVGARRVIPAVRFTLGSISHRFAAS